MRGRPRSRIPLLAALAGFAVLAVAHDLIAAGSRGSAKDRLDWSGSPTDRYLDGDELAEELGGAAGQFAACASIEGVGALDGEPVWLEFGIDPQGRPQPTIRAGSSPSDTALMECLYGVLQGLEYPEHDGVLGSYSYPVVLLVEDGEVHNAPYPVVLSSDPALIVPLLTVPPDLSVDDLQAIAAELVSSSG